MDLLIFILSMYRKSSKCIYQEANTDNFTPQITHEKYIIFYNIYFKAVN